MTRDDILRMAKEAGLVRWLPDDRFSDGVWWVDAHEPGVELQRFAELVAEKAKLDERERCAKICDSLGSALRMAP